MTNPARINAARRHIGNDRLAATSVFGQRATLPVTLDGGDGNDTMFGGDANDLMLGGNGDDFTNSVGGGADVITGDAGSDTAFVDASDTVSTVEFKTFVGKLGGSAKTITGAAGDTLSMPLAWTHPKAWKQIRSIEAIAFDGAKQVGSVKLTPAGAVSATGKLSIAKDATTIGHHGKTVTAKLGLQGREVAEGPHALASTSPPPTATASARSSPPPARSASTPNPSDPRGGAACAAPAELLAMPSFFTPARLALIPSSSASACSRCSPGPARAAAPSRPRTRTSRRSPRT